MATAFFRCDASASMGSGHVMRCLTLADNLRDKGWQCSFITSEETIQTVPFLSQSGHTILKLQDPVPGKADVMIVDHYGLTRDDETGFRALTERILSFEDLVGRPHDCDVLLDTTYGRKATEYKGCVPDHTQILAGTDYALLRPQFAKMRPVALVRRAQAEGINRIMVSLGSTDPHNTTEKVLNGLALLKIRPAIDIVAGSGNPHLKKLESQIAAMKADGWDIKININVSDMAGMMSATDLAIGAGGTTSWERCCLGLPTLLIEIADNQKDVAAALHKQGCVQNLGWHEDLTPAALVQAINNLTPAILKTMAEKAAQLCSGRGADAVVPALLPPWGKDAITLKFMTAADTERLFQWQCLPETRKYANNPEAPSWEGHKAWMTNMLNNPDRYSYVIQSQGKPAGMIRLDRTDDKTRIFIISILLDPEFYGRGVASAALRLARQIEVSAVFKAQIMAENKASRALFERLNFVPINETWYTQTP